MKSINEKFTDEEFKEIGLIKARSGLSWHDFIIQSSKAYSKDLIEPETTFKTAKVDKYGKAMISRTFAGKEIEYRLKK